MKFSEYRENRDTLEFDIKFSLLCEGIARSGHSFDSWWSSEGLPVIMESYRFENEEELLIELFGTGGNPGRMTRALGRGVGNIGRGITGAWDSLKQHGQAFGQATSDAYGGQQTPGGTWNPETGQWEQPQQQDPATQQQAALSPEKQQRLDSFQRGIDQSTDQIKQRFSSAMRDFLNTVQDDAKQQNNAHMWQIAKSFNQKVMQAAQPAIDSFKSKGRYGPRQEGGYQDQFDQARGAIQQNQQTDLKQQLQQKHGQAEDDQMAGGPQDLSQQQPEAQPKERHPTLAAAQASGIRPMNRHMRPGMTVR